MDLNYPQLNFNRVFRTASVIPAARKSLKIHYFVHGVNGNEPIENMQIYMGYSPEKLERRLGQN